jgi:YidC/Oxa1 family membrane protein insertase
MYSFLKQTKFTQQLILSNGIKPKSSILSSLLLSSNNNKLQYKTIKQLSTLPSSSNTNTWDAIQSNNSTNLLDTTTDIITTTAAAAAATDPTLQSMGYGPVDMIIRTMTLFHEYSGLSWWISIVTGTVALRFLLLPVHIKAMQAQAKLVILKPELETLSTKMRDPTISEADRMLAMHQIQTLYAKHNFKIYHTFLPLFVQMPVYISCFFALRHMCETFPSFTHGGAFWFENLAAPDPIYCLPVATSVLLLASLELGGGDVPVTEQTRLMKNVVRGMTVAIVPMTMGLPSGVFVYWAASNTFTLAQAIALQVPGVKESLGVKINAPGPITSTIVNSTQPQIIMLSPSPASVVMPGFVNHNNATNSVKTILSTTQVQQSSTITSDAKVADSTPLPSSNNNNTTTHTKKRRQGKTKN